MFSIWSFGNEMKQAIILILLLSAALGKAQAQAYYKYLYLSKVGGSFEAKYYLQDRIALKHIGSDFISIGIITKLTDTSLFLFDTEMLFDSIAEIDIRGKHFKGRNFSRITGKLMVAGVGLPLIDIINQKQMTSGSMLVIGGAIVASGVILQVISRKKFVPGGEYKMQVINIQLPEKVPSENDSGG